MSPVEPSDSLSPVDMVVYQTTDPEALRHASLVLAAASCRHRIRWQSADGWQIVVGSDLALLAEHEITAYFQENPPAAPTIPVIGNFRPAFLLMNICVAATLVFIYWMTGPWQSNGPWFAAASAKAGAIIDDHQYYRTVTALLLHADLQHVVGNSLISVFLLHFYFHLFGNGLGLAALLASSALANWLNAALQMAEHDSVGFSTAVFACIGILSSFQFHRHASLGRIGLLVPVMTGSAILAMLGSEGQRTDLGAHFFGLCCGLLTGYLLSSERILHLRFSLAWQTLLLSLSLLAVAGCWQLALS